MFHFTFLDGALGYDCVSCGSRCCHGLGFGLTPRELVPLLARAPGLAPFLQLQERGVSAFDLSDGCWLLAGDGRCELEVGHGREAKPAVCRIFPLKLVRIGAALVVDVQLLQCPLAPAPSVRTGPGATVIRHDETARELAALAAENLFGEAQLPAGSPDDVWEREARVREATADHLQDTDPLDVVATTLAPPTASPRTDPPSAQTDARSPRTNPPSARERLASLREGWRGFFAVDAGEAGALDARVAPLFALALPSLRLAALTAPGAPPYPRAMRALPARLLAGAFLASLSARAGRAPSLRGIAEVWRSTPLVRAALAAWPAPATLGGEPAPASAPAEIADALDRVRAEAARSTLGDALGETALAPPLRPLLLRLVSERLGVGAGAAL